MMYFRVKIEPPCRQRLFLFAQTQSVKSPAQQRKEPAVLCTRGSFRVKKPTVLPPIATFASFQRVVLPTTFVRARR